MTPEMRRQVLEWNEEHWPDATVGDVLEKLSEELERLENAMESVPMNAESVGEEAADMTIVIEGLCLRTGVDLDAAVIARWEIVSGRSPEGSNATKPDILEILDAAIVQLDRSESPPLGPLAARSSAFQEVRGLIAGLREEP